MNIFGNPILGSILALIFIYAMLSILVSILNEWLSSKLKTRSKMLKASIQDLLYDPANSYLASVFFDHHMVIGRNDEKKEKSIEYISGDLFADVLIDMIISNNQATVDLDMSYVEGKRTFKPEHPEDDEKKELMEIIGLSIEHMSDSALKNLLNSFYLKSSNNYENLVHQIKTWYDEYQDRVTGWYRAKQKKTLLVIGFVVAIGLNVDSIHLFNVINKNDALRAQLVMAAENTANNYAELTEEQKKDFSNLINTIDTLNTQVTDNSAELDSLKNQLESVFEFTEADNKRYKEVKKTMDLISQYNLPIGWKDTEPPVLWWNTYLKKQKDSIKKDSFPTPPQITSTKKVEKAAESKNNDKKNSLEMYIEKRNKGEDWSIPLYFLGIIITGYSLSFGAPFWFDLLTKFVNLKRAGKDTGAIRKQQS